MSFVSQSQTKTELDNCQYEYLLNRWQQEATNFYKTHYQHFYASSFSRCEMLLRLVKNYQNATTTERKGIEKLLGKCFSFKLKKFF